MIYELRYKQMDCPMRFWGTDADDTAHCEVIRDELVVMATYHLTLLLKLIIVLN